LILRCIYTSCTSPQKGGKAIAIYGFDVRPISRLKGGSVVKTASYILRTDLYDTYNNERYYSYGQDLLYSEILVPENAPPSFQDLQTLLTAMDQAERRYDARTGRLLRLSLPNDAEFSTEERVKLVKGYLQEVFVAQGMCAILAIHEGRNSDPKKNNPHAHVILTDRPVDSNGFCHNKNRDWNKKCQLRKWRRLWADTQNRAFKEKGLELKVTHESLEVQGSKREPTVPLGRAAMALERKGIQTKYGNKNREIQSRPREEEKAECLKPQRKRERKHDRGR